MSKKIDPRRKALHAAWRGTRTAWHHAERSVGALVRANNALLASMGRIGAAAARRARRELQAALKQLARHGREARTKFDAFAREHARPVAATSRPAPRARRRAS